MGGLRRLRRKNADRYAVEPLHGVPESGGEKLSAVILDFARPLTESVGDDDFEAAIMMATLCWNIGLFPDKDQERGNPPSRERDGSRRTGIRRRD